VSAFHFELPVHFSATKEFFANIPSLPIWPSVNPLPENALIVSVSHPPGKSLLTLPSSLAFGCSLIFLFHNILAEYRVWSGDKQAPISLSPHFHPTAHKFCSCRDCLAKNNHVVRIGIFKV
jgi:hypothetical protein